VKGEAAVGIQAEVAGGHASQEIGQIFAIGSASHNLVRPRTEDRFWLCAAAAAVNSRFRGNDVMVRRWGEARARPRCTPPEGSRDSVWRAGLLIHVVARRQIVRFGLTSPRASVKMR
jgi:hypothetical protein